jgi:imidazolonepropionase-like amidohydrolase
MRQLFRGGIVLDGEHASLVGHAVLVDGGRIVDVGPVDRFAGYSGATVDLGGATLLPGLIDCHVHLCFGAEADVMPLLSQLRPADFALRALSNAQAALRGGITTVRDLGGYDYAEIAVRNAIRTGRHTGPTIVCAGKMICITGGHGWFIGLETDGPEACLRAVRTNIKAGADWIKFMATGGVLTAGIDPLAAHQTVDETEALVREANRLGRRTACHATGAAGILQAVVAGATSIEHGFELTDEIIAAMLARDTVLVPTLSAMACADCDTAARLSPYVTERVAAYREMQRDSALRFYRAGGRIAMGTDAGTPFNRHGANAQELTLMVNLGISPLDTIRASTSRAADLLELKDRGRIAAGCRADLLIVNGNPLENMAAASDPANHRLVIKDGQPVSVTEDQDAQALLALVGASGDAWA